MVKLPGGFSPWQAVQQVADDANPFNGSRDRDVFADKYNQVNKSTLWQPANPSAGYQPVINVDPTNINSTKQTGNNSYESGGVSRPSYSQDDLAYLDGQMGNLDRQYNRVDTQLQNALRMALQNYENTKATGETQYNRNTRDINLKESVSEQGRQRELGKVDTGARMLANSLRQKLGLASGSGSSAYQVSAPDAVRRQATEQRGDVLGDYSANFAQIANTRKDTEDDWTQMQNQLSNEYNRRQMESQGEFATLKSDIDGNRQRVAGEKAKLLGGGYAGVKSAMAPYEQRIAEGESLIDGLYNKYAAGYKVDPIKQRTVNLRDYATDQVAVRDQQATGTEDPYAPYKNYAKEEEDQRLVQKGLE